MTNVVNLTKYRHDREKAIDERIANAERRINELHLLIYAEYVDSGSRAIQYSTSVPLFL